MKFKTVVFSLTLLLSGFSLGYWFAMGRFVMKSRDLFLELVTDGKMRVDLPEIRVIGRQFSWHFHYPGSDGILGYSDYTLVENDNPAGIDWSSTAAADDFVTTELILLVGRPVKFKVTSYDVIHGVSGFPDGSQQDAIPGKEMPMFLPAESAPVEGVLKCNQLCGVGHDDHHAPFKFVAAEDYDKWASEQLNRRR